MARMGNPASATSERPRVTSSHARSRSQGARARASSRQRATRVARSAAAPLRIKSGGSMVRGMLRAYPPC